MLARGFSKEGILPLLHFFRRDIFLVCSNAPLLAEGIRNRAVAIAPEHILNWHVHSRPRRIRLR